MSNELTKKESSKLWNKRITNGPRKVKLPHLNHGDIEFFVWVYPANAALMIVLNSMSDIELALNTLRVRCRNEKGEHIFNEDVLQKLGMQLTPQDLDDIQKTVNVDLLGTEINDQTVNDTADFINNDNTMILLMKIADHLQIPLCQVIELPLWEIDLWQARFSNKIQHFKKG